MSLEQRIEELTAAVQALTAVIGKVQAPEAAALNQIGQTASGLPRGPQSQWSDEEKAAVAAHQMQQTPSPNAKPEPQKSNDTSSTSDASLSESAPVSYDDVKKLVIELSKKDKEKAVAALARFGVKTAKDLAQDRWADFAAYVKDILAGGTDPEAGHE